MTDIYRLAKAGHSHPGASRAAGSANAKWAERENRRPAGDGALEWYWSGWTLASRHSARVAA